MGKLFGLSIFIFLSLRDWIDFSDMVMFIVITTNTSIVFIATTTTTHIQLITEFIQY